MNKTNLDITANFKEVKKIILRLQIKTTSEYMKRYKEDTRLPSNPSRTYSSNWISWYDFLGKGVPPQKYETFKMAKDAVLSLGIKSMSEYKRRYKEDARLTIHPNILYVSDWTNWYDFLETTTPINKYETLGEAKKAVEALGITTSKEYNRYYNKDPRLPSYIEKYFSEEWTGWYDFFGRRKKSCYKTINEAKEAVSRLGIRNPKGYARHFKEDPLLPSKPYRTYKSKWVNWPSFLSRPKITPYSNIEDASSAAVLLGISTCANYRKKRKEDPKLPYAPNEYYSEPWQGWDEFLQKKPNYYETYKEASAAAKNLGIKHKSQHIEQRYRDPRLCRVPSVHYPNEWTDWANFLGTELTVHYPTYSEASAAAFALNLNTRAKYVRDYKQDPRLHSVPKDKYPKDWISWPSFLKPFYEDPIDARNSAIALGIKNVEQYKELHKKDSRLPSGPIQFYGRRGYKIRTYKEFLGLKYLELDEIIEYCKENEIVNFSQYNEHKQKNPRLRSLYCVKGYTDTGAKKVFHSPGDFDGITDSYKEWKLYAEDFCSKGRNLSVKTSVIKKFIFNYIMGDERLSNPSAIFEINYPVKKITNYIKANFTNSDVANNHLHEFLSSIFNKTCCDIDDDTGSFIPLAGYLNPIKKVKWHDKYKPIETTKQCLPYHIVEKAKSWMLPADSCSFKSLPHLHDLLQLDWYDVSKDLIDENDNNCVWRIIKKSQKFLGKRQCKVDTYQIWSPVRAISLFFLLSFPLRGQQISWLDSGEADEYRLEILNEKFVWVKNTAPLAQKGRTQGVLRRIPVDNEKFAVGLYATTNKTSNCLKEGGYKTSWIPEQLIPWIIRLRDWQEKYNPIKKLTKWEEISLPGKVDKSLLERRSDQAFLFRNAGTSSLGKRCEPLNPKQCFHFTLAAVLYQIQEKVDQLASKRLNSSGGICIYKSVYTPHTLRVSLITAYVLDGDIDINIVSKLVGHSRILMTLYYTKIGATEIAEKMNEAHKKAFYKGVDRARKMCEDFNIQELSPSFVANDSTILSSLDKNHNASSFLFTDIGICPVGGGLCNQGGEPLPAAKTYGPVPAGYLGRRNCPRCRFFISGPVFLAGLQAVGNEIAYSIQLATGKMLEIEEVQKKLEEQRFDCDQGGTLFNETAELSRINAELEAATEQVDALACDYISVTRLVENSIEIINKVKLDEQNPSNALALITNGNEYDLKLSFEESTSEIRQLSELCENAEIFMSCSARHSNVRRSQLIDMMVKHNGFKPIMFSLSENQQLILGNQMTRLLLARLKSWEKVQGLFEGRLKISDFDLNEDNMLTPIKQELITLFENNRREGIN